MLDILEVLGMLDELDILEVLDIRLTRGKNVDVLEGIGYGFIVEFEFTELFMEGLFLVRGAFAKLGLLIFWDGRFPTEEGESDLM